MNRIIGKILIVGEDGNSRLPISDLLSSENYQVFRSRNGHGVLGQIHSLKPDAVILDENGLGLKGIESLHAIKGDQPQIPVLFIGPRRDVNDIVKIMFDGAYYYFVEPPDNDKLIQVLDRAVQEIAVQFSVPMNRHLKGESRIISNSSKMGRVIRIIQSVAKSKSSVLITGETGTGKELVASELHHNNGGQNGKPFVPVNCAAIPRELVEAELFGHEKGAFTGAVSERIGKFEEADGGTLFLDEIGELALPAQAKLFRALEEREIERLGSNKKKKISFRLICATNDNLAEGVRKKRFRGELYYRINIVNIQLPPLRERIEDIPMLASSFLGEFCKREGKHVGLSKNSLEILTRYHWPGNVRQLRNVIERAVILTTGDLILPKDLSVELREQKRPGTDPKAVLPLKTLESQAVRKALTAYQGNVSRAARALGISRKSFYKRMREDPMIHSNKSGGTNEMGRDLTPEAENSSMENDP